MHAGLDFTRGARRGRRALRLVPVLLLAAALACAAPYLLAGALGLPAGVQTLWAGRTAAELTNLRAENAALHRALAAGEKTFADQTALRRFALPGPATPATLLARRPGALVLVCRNAAQNAPVLDAAGRFVGRVTATGPDTATAALVGTAACPVAGLVQGCAGLVERGAQGELLLTGLPVNAGLAAGQLVTTAGGCWLGRLAATPTPATDGLTAAAPLTDCADAWAATYYLAPESGE